MTWALALSGALSGGDRAGRLHDRGGIGRPSIHIVMALSPFSDVPLALAARTPKRFASVDSKRCVASASSFSLYIVDGRTEPGARVEVNEEPVKVETDGSFTKTVSFTREGWASIDVRALDAWGNAAAASRPVYVESP